MGAADFLGGDRGGDLGLAFFREIFRFLGVPMVVDVAISAFASTDEIPVSCSCLSSSLTFAAALKLEKVLEVKVLALAEVSGVLLILVDRRRIIAGEFK